MNRLAYLLSLICILAFSSCEEDKVYYHTAAMRVHILNGRGLPKSVGGTNCLIRIIM